MAKHNETGIKGEQIAQNFLEKNGYSILNVNWRFEQKEVDIIALDDKLLVFVEVKTRKNKQFGFPEDAVDYRKQDFLKTAAAAYMEEHPEYNEVRFDILSIILRNDKHIETKHFIDAFY